MWDTERYPRGEVGLAGSIGCSGGQRGEAVEVGGRDRFARALSDAVHRDGLYVRVAAPIGIDPDEMDGGHYISLSRPRELADRLAAYVAETH